MKNSGFFVKQLMLLLVLSLFFYSCDNDDDTPGNDTGNLSKGDTVWAFHLDDPALKINDAPLAMGKDGSIYFEAIPHTAGEKAHVVALNSDGSFKWKTEALADVSFGSNIVVGDDGMLYCTSGMFLYSINSANGQLNWTWECPKTIEVNGMEINSYLPLNGLALTNEGDLVFQSTGLLLGQAEAMFCVTPEGSLKWYSLRQNTSGNPVTVGPDGFIYSYGLLWDEQSENWKTYLLATNPETGSIEKRIEGALINSQVYTSFENNGDLVVAISNTVKSFSKENLSVNWEFGLNGPSSFPYSILTDDRGNTYVTPPQYVIGNDETGFIDNPELVSIPFFGVIDNNGHLTGADSQIYPYLKSTDRNGEEIWKQENFEVYGKSLLLSNDVLYCSNSYNYSFDTGADKIIAIKWDASMIQNGWPRISHDNRNTSNFNKW